jgi:MFS family permease
MRIAEPVNVSSYPANLKWRMLVLATLTNTLVVAAPSMGLPVLFDEISRSLSLSLVQVGIIWGISSLPGIFTGLLGGALGDRIGPKRVLIGACLLTGLFGGLRGLAFDFWTLAAGMFLMGMVTPLIPLNTLKSCSTWFPPRQLGLASGVLSMGMALGFLLGSMLSATMLSPWLGGWRNVLFFYAALALLLSLPWLLTRPSPEGALAKVAHSAPASFRQTLTHVLRIRNIWLLGFALLGVSGCIQGSLGYLPLYLRRIGWAPALADTALASFHTISMICVVPIALLSDRLGSRKKILLAASLSIITGIGLLSFVDGVLVWVAVCLAGFVRDGFMAVFMTSVIETDGIGPAFAGTATGVTMFLSGLGNLFAPPLGNSLAAIAPGMPFLFWGVLAAAGMGGLLAIQEKRLLAVPVVD